MHTSARLTFLFLVLMLSSGCPPVDGGPPDGGPPDGGPPDAGSTVIPVVDLRADVNRNGTVDLADPTEDEGEETWSAERGAVFLANIDDDTDRCPESVFPSQESDEEIASCHDAADEVVNGDDDLLDLARLRTVPWPDAPDDAVGTLSVSEAAANRVRLFRRAASGFELFVPGTSKLGAEALRQGAELAIEATDIVRDLQVWDGYADITFEITARGLRDGPARDVVRLRVSPVMTFHHLSPARTLFASKMDLVDNEEPFLEALRAVGPSAGVPEPLHEFETLKDRWMQDFFEPGYMSMPSAGGGQHVIRVNYRSPNVAVEGIPAPLRPASRIVFFLRGKDEAAVQQFQPGQPREMQTLNNMGNTETIPPYEKNGVSYPLGRLLRGSVPSYYPDPSFTRMLEAQRMQPPVYVDTSWLSVGHVDETLSFLPSSSPRGWVLLAGDPALARAMLEQAQEQGHGDATLFTGKLTRYGEPAQVTVSQVLAKTDVMNESAAAALAVDAQLEILERETGITEADIIRIPFLFERSNSLALAYQPGIVNLLAVSRSLVVAPEPYGPVIDGKDIFKVHVEQSLAAHGITVHWLDDWDLLHELAGEVHCGTNADRAIPEVKWWETGR